MPHTAEYRDEEESLQLRPYQKGGQQLPAHGHPLAHQISHPQNEFYILPLSREQRIASVRLHCCYQILWVLLVLFVILIPIYNWMSIVVTECLANRESEIIASVFIALFSGFVALVMAILNCCSRNSLSCYRARFCTFCFVLFTIVAALNFLIGIFFFAIPSCYFFLNAVVEAFQVSNGNWIQQLFYKYDLKISGILHLICSILSFSIGIGFAIIKNNFKYVRQIDLE